MNRYSIIGNLGGDAEVRQLESGDAVISFSVAVTESWIDKHTGERKERTDWIRVSRWVKAGGSTRLAEFLKKGTKVLVEGKPSARGWIPEGSAEVKANVELRADTIEILSPKQQSDGPAVQTPQPGGYAATYIATAGRSATPGYMNDALDQARQFAGDWATDNPDDLPF